MTRIGSTAAYATMVVGTALAFVAIRSAGTEAAAPAARPDGFPGEVGAIHLTFHVLLALAVVTVAARLTGALFRRLGQPPVMGEVVAGILLGPSCFGHLAPEAAAFVLPTHVMPTLGALSQVGIVLYMFLVGLRLDTSRLRERTRASVAISHASILVPFLFGAASALWLYPRFAPPGVSFTVFALFLGACMSVTAFPVLARILADLKMEKHPIGVTALACAAVDDVSAWCMLALVVGVARSDATDAVMTLLATATFVLLVVFLLRPALHWLVARHEARPVARQDAIAIICIAALVAALTTEAIGIHALFGAFLLGAVVPRDSTLAREASERLEDVVVVLLLPAFFAFTGMRTQIGLLAEPRQWAVCALIVLLASAGKFGGTYVAARLTGHSTRDAATLGVLMNTRGLMEVIVLNVGIDLGVISPTLFTMLVIMALITTLATAPLLRAIRTA